MLEHRQIETREVEDLQDLRITHDARPGTGATARFISELLAGDLHHIRFSVALRDLHDAQTIAQGVEPERLGIDGNGGAGIVIGGKITQMVTARSCAGILVMVGTRHGDFISRSPCQIHIAIHHALPAPRSTCIARRSVSPRLIVHHGRKTRP